MDREAKKEYMRKWRADNKERLIAYRLKYYEDNRERLISEAIVRQKNNIAGRKASDKKYREKNKEKHKIYDAKYRENNRERVRVISNRYYYANKDVSKRYYAENKEKCKERSRNTYENNKDRCKKAHKSWRERNKHTEDYKQKARHYLKMQRLKTKNNPQICLIESLRKRLYYALKAANTSKYMSAITLVGMPIPDFKKYIESKFTEGMSWENRSEWHLDHIKPCAAFDLTDVEQQKDCFHYSNMQPLWGKDNMSKGSFYEGKRHTHKKSR